MLEKQGAGRAVSCSDCYFRQELLCALKSNRVCPTFRATVGRNRKVVSSDQLTVFPSMPQLERAIDPAAHLPTVVTAPQRVSTLRQSDIPAQDPSSSGEPFTSNAPESRFSVAEVHAPSDTTNTDQVLVRVRASRHDHDRQAPARVAAARVDFDNELIVDAGERLDEVAVTSRSYVPLRGFSHSRSSRIAERIAARYPGSSPAV